MRVKDNWEYVQDFCNDFGRLPKDADELECFLSYVDEKRKKEGCGITKMMETPVSDDLEEAAMEFADREYMVGDVDRSALYKGFWHGAKWQKDKDTRDMYMSDNRHFQKIYELGRKEEREQMMTDAVEGEVIPLKSSMEILIPNLTNNTYKVGDKVKLVIIKKD